MQILTDMFEAVRVNLPDATDEEIALAAALQFASTIKGYSPAMTAAGGQLARVISAIRLATKK